jgi:hypothetical protein
MRQTLLTCDKLTQEVGRARAVWQARIVVHDHFVSAAGWTFGETHSLQAACEQAAQQAPRLRLLKSTDL